MCKRVGGEKGVGVFFLVHHSPINPEPGVPHSSDKSFICQYNASLSRAFGVVLPF